MAFLTADVVPSDDEEQPFKVVFLRGDEILTEWLVDSQEEGEEQLLEAVRELGASDEDGEEKDENEDEDDDEENEDEDKDEDEEKPAKRR
jgi:hypothetical protein